MAKNFLADSSDFCCYSSFKLGQVTYRSPELLILHKPSWEMSSVAKYGDVSSQDGGSYYTMDELGNILPKREQPGMQNE